MTDERPRRIRRFLLYALAAHLVGDFLLQTDRMVANKLDSPEVRALHVTIYALAFLPVVFATDWTRRRAAAFLGTVWITHFAIDSRRWIDAAPVLFDQALHVVALALAFVVAARFADRDATAEHGGR